MAQAWFNIHHDEMMTSIKTLSVRTDDTVRTVLHVAAYCRVSTDDPVQEYSLEAQEEHWKSYINNRILLLLVF